MKQELLIEKLVYGGEGLARVAQADGRKQAVFVAGTLPGERVLAEVQAPRRGRTSAVLLEILQASPDRVAPGCEYFPRCGGCQWQHAGAPAQVGYKRDILLETLRRTGGVDWHNPVEIHASEPWGYRNRIRLQAAEGGWGYFEAGSHRVLPVTHCPIADPELSAAISTLKEQRAGDEIELATTDYQVGGFAYQVSPGSFFQVNRFLVEELVRTVAAGVSGGTVVDLYSGVGLFAVALAPHFRRVVAVESHPGAARDLRANAAGLPNVEAMEEDAADFFRRRGNSAEAGGLDLVVADPPRAGLGPELVEALLAAAPAGLHLVSCDPATLARDVKALAGGGYRITELHLFDLFPQTYHIETVVKMRREP